MTPAATQSHWVKSETHIAIGLEHKGQLRFIPLDVKPCDAPLFWTEYQHVSFCGRYEDGLAALLAELEPEQREREANEKVAEEEAESKARQEVPQREAERQAQLAAEKVEAEREAREKAPSRPELSKKRRRVDAAVPSHAQVGQHIDLLVQVRFPNSSLLGIKDWPTRQKPSSIEQASEPVALEFPVDPQTGKLGYAYLEIRVVAPDFGIEGVAQQRVEVPPDGYSKLVSFLLTATKAGSCWINVEVYSRLVAQ
jgi:hypothetical protein